jgi:hypothetical protein
MVMSDVSLRAAARKLSEIEPTLYGGAYHSDMTDIIVRFAE